jgi:hypothetical protein
MDMMVWVVTIALIALLAYSIYTAPPSTGCLSADAARARDEKQRAAAARRQPAGAPIEPPPVIVEAAPTAAETPSRPVADLMRNPLTGETAAVPTNYRFAKKWIKEAMVVEGLLDRIYGNNDLDARSNEKVRVALKQFRSLAKYHA